MNSEGADRIAHVVTEEGVAAPGLNKDLFIGSRLLLVVLGSDPIVREEIRVDGLFAGHVNRAGTEEQKRLYLDKMVSGEWTGTMNLTEPQAGSDLSAIRAKAEPVGDGRYKISGQKIFITYGDHDMADNIVHLVLARLPDAPEGTRGISLFLVPKFIPDAEGNPGRANDLKVVSLEHKMGLHGSPTAVMEYA